ncbi:signal peptidase I [Microbacterium sp. 179-I 3D3 NHS]|uniref:signal peptidase I n=1 Tax=Microbacterium sp. 179-I 3D3 NHS TaxID=3142382 RepID=UPI0039A15494
MLRAIVSRAATTLVASALLVIVVWFVFSALTGATLIVLRTGSMSPTMPQGAVAVSVPLPAEKIRVGDVVTVQRQENALPVTHRVVEVRPVPDTVGERGARELVLKGDDNDSVDHLPYLVTDARRTVASVPMVGAVIMLLQSPLGMGVLTLTTATLTAWALWPRRPEPTSVAEPTGGALPSQSRSGSEHPRAARRA